MKGILIALTFVAVIYKVNCHGMLSDPINRGSMWRHGYPYPVNYEDDGLWCGGAWVQWGQNQGKCGFCGDNYAQPQPRDNENGGKFGLGIIPDSSRYQQGQIIDAVVNITASHYGHFEFAICNLDNGPESEECFASSPLLLADGASKFPLLTLEAKLYPVQIVLPAELSCSHCVLRWHYRAGNNWGMCDDGTGAIGCGEQETFRTCSDISIAPTKLSDVNTKPLSARRKLDILKQKLLEKN